MRTEQGWYSNMFRVLVKQMLSYSLCKPLTFFLGVIKVFGQRETVGDLQCVPYHQSHQEPSHQLRATALLLTVLDHLQCHLYTMVDRTRTHFIARSDTLSICLMLKYM